MDVTMNEAQKIKITLNPVNAKGAAAKVDGVPAWTVGSGDATLVVADDGMSADIVSGTPGTSQVSVIADADLGQGNKPISDLVNVTVTALEAVSLNLSAGEPVDK